MTEPRSFSYERIAADYSARVDEAPFNALYERPAMLALLPPVQGLRVLDAGCGSGWYAEQLFTRGAGVVAIDESPTMVALTAARLKRLRTGPQADGSAAAPPPEVIQADLSMPLAFLPAGALHGVLSALALHYVRDWTAVFAEFRRVLAPAGWLLFSTHHPGTEAVKYGTRRYFDVEEIEDDLGWVGPVRFFRRPLSSITGALEDSGFGIERLVEPLPTAEFRAADPETCSRLLAAPEFLIVLARVRQEPRI